MTTIAPFVLSEISDSDLLTQTQHAVQQERQATTHLIALLMEIEARQLYLGQGFSSLFTYCTGALHLSEHAAYGRIEAARAARRFPIVLDLLQRGELTLTAIGLLRPHLTPENHCEVLARARHQTKRSIEQWVATLHPQPDVPSTVRRLPMRATTPARCDAPPAAVAPSTRLAAPRAVATSKSEMAALAPERFKIQFTVSRETYDRLRHAQDLMRHTLPSGDPAIIFERALGLLVAELEHTKLRKTDHPRSARPTDPKSRHIPAAVVRAVWKRDGGRCAFRGLQGRCGETGFLEYHHVKPFADGGEASVANIELRCRAHNVYEAHEHFGIRDALFSWETDASP
jgi:hypothetical protein